MASRTQHFRGFSVVQGDITVNVNFSRFEKQFEDAQKALDMAVMTSMIPFMPKQTGNFIDRTIIMSTSMAGTGIVVAAAPPMGRYLYEGKVMVDSETGKGPMKIPDGPGGAYVLRFRKGAELVATTRDLDYSKAANPDVTDHWFDAAKKKDLKAWVSLVKQKAGGGSHG